MKKSILLAFALLVLAGCQTGWQDFRSEELGFSVSTPGKLEHKADSGSDGNVIHSFAATGPHTASYFVFVKDAAGKESDSVFAEVRDAGLHSTEGTLLADEEIALDGHPGREFKIRGVDEAFYLNRIYLADKRLYHVFVTALDVNAASQDAERFFASFKVLELPPTDTVSAGPEFTYVKDYNEHEGAEELSVRLEHKEGTRRLSLQFNVFVAEDVFHPWFQIYLAHSDSSRLNILFENSLKFITGDDTIKLSSPDNYYDPYNYEGSSLDEDLVYPVADEVRKRIACLDTSTLVVVTGVKDELRISFTEEDWQLVRWFYGEVAEESREK